ncbi:MAG: DUF4912 domain-containing protein [Gemmataceae bacterium]
MTREQLRSLNCKQLAEMARRRGIAGWHDFRKEQLVEALTRSFRNEARRLKNGAVAKPAVASTACTVARPPAIPLPVPTPTQRDQLLLVVRGPHWLSCHWEVSVKSQERARAALGPKWYSAKPTLRLFEVSHNDAGYGAEKAIRDITIHGGTDTWYIDVPQPPRCYRVDLGYLTTDGAFYCMLRSDVVSMPAAGSADARNDTIDPIVADRLAALSGHGTGEGSCRDLRPFLEERLRRPIGAPSILRLTTDEPFEFAVEADLIVYGRTLPGARVELQDQPVEVTADGSFAMRFRLAETRQIIRCVGTSPDGSEERTIILHVERNIRQLEPASLHETD